MNSNSGETSAPPALGFVGLALFLCVIFFVVRGCVGTRSPHAEVVSASARYVYGLIDHAVTVSGQVRNRGRDGSVTVYAAVHDGRSLWKHSTVITLPAGASSSFEIGFAEWQNGPAWYQVSADWEA